MGVGGRKVEKGCLMKSHGKGGAVLLVKESGYCKVPRKG